MADKLKLLQDEIENAQDYLNKLQDEYRELTGKRYHPPIRLTPKYEPQDRPLWARRGAK